MTYNGRACGTEQADDNDLWAISRVASKPASQYARIAIVFHCPSIGRIYFVRLAGINAFNFHKMYERLLAATRSFTFNKL